MLILNLGCGTKTSPSCTNIDWSPYLRLKQVPVVRSLARYALRGERRARYDALAKTVVAHDLRKGIPAADGTVDVVYHSHVLEHLDRDEAPAFMREVWRVLRPGGVQRVVVPDLEVMTRRYLAGLDAGLDAAQHDEHIALMIEQMVRREAAGTRAQPPLRRRIENRVLGDARQRGETHQWMYDRVTLAALLERCGFTSIVRHQHDTSDIPGWNAMALDLDEHGGQYKPDSLYLEARRP